MYDPQATQMDYLLRIVAAGCQPIRLNNKTKAPIESFESAIATFSTYKNYLDAFNFILASIANGKGVGFLVAGDFYVVDCDTKEAVLWMETFLFVSGLECPRVKTRKGVHYYLKFPQGLRSSLLKHHICHPTVNGVNYNVDFKFGPRSMVVLPGAVMMKDGQGFHYKPMNEWCEPPVVHPHDLIPGLDLYRSEVRNFAVDERNLAARISRAKHFLSNCAKPSICHQGGRKNLLSVMCHLTAFLRLDPALAVKLATSSSKGKNGDPVKSWNAKCRNIDRTPYPWSIEELLQAAKEAQHLVPGYGVWLLGEQARLSKTLDLLGQFLTILASFEGCDSLDDHSPQDLRSRFLDWSGIQRENCSLTRFGISLSKAIACGFVPMQKVKRHGLIRYVGPTIEDLAAALEVTPPWMENTVRAK